MNRSDLEQGARNLLVHCAAVRAGSSLLIVHEHPELGWYDDAAPAAVAAFAEQLGLSVTTLPVGAPTADQHPGIEDLVSEHDTTVFFARIGDQNRFEEFGGGGVRVMSYARNGEALASSYGRAHHHAMVALKEAINDLLLSAKQITITCPLGTTYAGNVAATKREQMSDVAVRRFPLGVPQPILAEGFSGRVALSRYLTPTGSRAYDPPNVRIGGTVFAHVEGHRLIDLEGNADGVAAIRAQYDRIADLFGIERDFVHSWHAGMHPGSIYRQEIAADPDRWSNNAFTNPRMLHFHTCGAYAPGEICWNVLDATVTVDDAALWERGALQPARFERTQQVLADWPELAPLFRDPARAIGAELA